MSVNIKGSSLSKKWRQQCSAEACQPLMNGSIKPTALQTNFSMFVIIKIAMMAN